MSQPVLSALLPNRSFKVPVFMRQVGRGVDQNRTQMRIIICFTMEEEKAGLGRNRQANFLSNFEATAAFEALLSQKYLDVTQEFSLIRGRKSAEDGKIAG
jgi:hypothetical protein